MRFSTLSITPVSPRSKNMPRLVRATFTSLPPVMLSTVSERAMRGPASEMISSHSSSESKPPNTITRGCFMFISTVTSRSSTRILLGDSVTGASGTGTGCGSWLAGAAAWVFSTCSVRWLRSVSSSAWMATSSCQPLDFIASSTVSGATPACACAMIQLRSSTEMYCCRCSPAFVFVLDCVVVGSTPECGRLVAERRCRVSVCVFWQRRTVESGGESPGLQSTTCNFW